MVDVVKGLDVWFSDRLIGLDGYRPETVAYVVGVLKAFCKPNVGDDLTNRSVVLAYNDARLTGDFVAFQRIGDWVLWADIIVPTYIEPDREAAESVARLSYYSCNRIMMGQWRCFEQLADELPEIVINVRRKLL